MSEQTENYRVLSNKFNTITNERNELIKSMREYKINANKIGNTIKQMDLEITKSNEKTNECVNK